MSGRTPQLLIGASIAALAIASCGSDSSRTSVTGTVEISITDEGCNPAEVTVPSGPTAFHVRNNGADSISEFEVLDGGTIIGEKESLTPGLEATVTIDLKPGTYTLACPGGTKTPAGKLIVTGSENGSSAATHGHSGDAATDGCVPAASTNSSASSIKATLSDFKIALAASSVAAGPVVLDATNQGTHPHEVVVVKGVAPAAMTTKTNGAVDEDKLPPGAGVGELEAFSPGRSCSAGFELTSGTYTLFCDVVGDEGGHFIQGMFTTLVVT
ncbi:MAG: high-affinity iron transporter [Acidimicrobiaceae bacterium]